VIIATWFQLTDWAVEKCFANSAVNFLFPGSGVVFAKDYPIKSKEIDKRENNFFMIQNLLL